MNRERFVRQVLKACPYEVWPPCDPEPAPPCVGSYGDRDCDGCNGDGLHWVDVEVISASATSHPPTEAPGQAAGEIPVTRAGTLEGDGSSELPGAATGETTGAAAGAPLPRTHTPAAHPRGG